ncbi:TPA: hypothetical protein GXZ54_00590 [bacterium]|jgi:hypothetical protein|nr:hypothetical protein [bacterium]
MNREANVALLKRIHRSIKYHLEVLDFILTKVSDLDQQKSLNIHKSHYLNLLEDTEGLLAKYDVTPEYESELKKVLRAANINEDEVDPNKLGPIIVEASRRDIEELRHNLELVDNKDEVIVGFARSIFGYDQSYMAGIGYYYPGFISGL